MKNNIIILGGGQAGIYAAREIRQNDTESNIKILSEENLLPYERPPLSKDFLLDKKNEDLKISLAKKLTDQAFGIVTAKARILISEVLEENPYQIDALYLAGLTAFQNSRNDIAKKVWSTVFEINPETKYKNSINENLLKMK